VFLQQRELNEVYTGGVGSYGLLTMIASFLLNHPSRRAHTAATATHTLYQQLQQQQQQTNGAKGNGSGAAAGGKDGKKGETGGKVESSGAPTAGPPVKIEGCLGTLLLDFFFFYGRLLNSQGVGVSCRQGGHFFSKKDAGTENGERPFLLSIEDPQDPSNDLGRNSFAFPRVRSVLLSYFLSFFPTCL
jgi:non-canonical poly(A) RNA polymerase PAPD5/7